MQRTTLEELAMQVYKCDLCGQIKECVQKEIDYREYDMCPQCWNALQAKLQGKGRVKEVREIILLPRPEAPAEEEEEKPAPERPPTIFGHSERPN